MNERIKQLIDYYGISIRSFEQKIMVSESLIYRGLKRNSDFGASVISNILNYCSDISPDWLLLGKGEMFRKETQIQQSEVEIYNKIIAGKEKRCEELIRENERLLVELERLKKAVASYAEDRGAYSGTMEQMDV